MASPLASPSARQVRRRARRPWSARRLLRRWRTLYIQGFLLVLVGNYAWGCFQQGAFIPPDQFLATYALFAKHPVIFLAVLILLSLPVVVDIVIEVRAKQRVDTRAQERQLYLEQLAAKYQQIPLVVGDTLVPELRLLVRSVFQTLILRRRLTQRTADDGTDLPLDESASATSIPDALRKGGSSGRMVILGAPGSGKTTLLYTTVSRAAEQLRGQGTIVPISLRLPDLARAFNASGELVDGRLAAILQEREAFLAAIEATMEGQRDSDATHPGLYAHFLEAQIRTGKTQLFLDALDEIDDAATRTAVVRWITSLPIAEGGAIVVTSRLTEFASSPFGDAFTQWQIRDITHDTRVKLAAALFPPFMQEQGVTDPRDPQAFVHQLEHHPQAAQWGGNPLLFTLAAYAFVKNDDLPAVRSSLYGEVVDALILAKDHDHLSERRRVLGELALALYTAPGMSAGTGVTLRKFGPRELPTLLGGIADPPAQTTPDDLVEWVRRPGILDQAAEGRLQFRHKTFQEYLLAVALAQRLIRARRTDDLGRETALWHRLATERDTDAGQWFEPLRLLVGEWCGPMSQSYGSGLAREWLLQTEARFRTQGDEGALVLVLASLAEISDLRLLGADFPTPAILTAWSTALLDAATQPASDRYGRLQDGADSVRVLPETVRGSTTTQRFLAVLTGSASLPQQFGALAALARLRDAVPVEAVTPFLTQGATPEIRAQAALVLLRQGTRGQPAVLTALASSDGQARQAVAQALADVGEEGRPIFVAALQNADAQVRALAAQAVSAVAEPTRGDIARDLQAARMPQDWLVAILAQMTAPAEVGLETWQVVAEVDPRFARKREAIAELSRLGMDPNRLATLRTTALPPPITDPARFPRSLAERGFQSFVIDGVEVILPPLALVPAGSFLMGSDKQRDSDAYDDEIPQHPVVLDTFQLARYPLTVAEYACFVRATGHQEPQEYLVNRRQQVTQRLDHPVVNISWEDTRSYVAWVAQVTGEPWGMPSEAQWEKAARGTDGRIYPWGNTWDVTADVTATARRRTWMDRLPLVGRFRRNRRPSVSSGPQRANTSANGPGGTTPVGSYADGVSPYGVYDMAGNVWEWTSSLFQPYPYDANDGREDPRKQGSRTLRGGSWVYTPRFARAAYRNGDNPTSITDYVGARVVCGVRPRSS